MPGRPDKILADHARELKHWVGPTAMSSKIMQAEKIVLDDAAIKMAVRISNAPPRDVLRMLDCSLPPATWTWIEFGSEAMLAERRLYAEEQGRDVRDSIGEVRPEWARCGLLIHSFELGFRVACIEHGTDPKVLFEWPIQYEIVSSSQGSAAHPGWLGPAVVEKSYPGRLPRLEQTGILWGYGSGTPGLARLNRKAQVVMPTHMQGVAEATTRATIANSAAQELTGLTRLTVAILSMMNTVLLVDDPIRPKGRFLSGAKSHPYAERRVAVLNIPHRIRQQYEYVKKEIRNESDRIRKRLHRVKAHFRHSRAVPVNGDGWERCQCPGREGSWWHKRIGAHWRGDESLGVVEREYTVVRAKS